MTHEELKTRLAEITAEIMQIDNLPEGCALIYIYADGNRVKPFVSGNGYVLHQMLKACAQNTDDFRGMLADVVDDLKMDERKDLLDMAVSNLESIADMAAKLTSGNVSHNGATIQGKAVGCAEYIKKYR